MSYHSSDLRETVVSLNQWLLRHYGRQGWWPTTSVPGCPPVYHIGNEGQPVSDAQAYEIIAGAILTQNTSWRNVEKAIVRLTEENLLDIQMISHMDDRLENAVRPAGYYNQKARRLREISARILESGGIPALRTYPVEKLRNLLLSWNGIGPETADSILCYAFSKPVFVVDAYTKRLFRQIGLPSDTYRDMQELVHHSIPPSAAEYGDFHARIVKVFTMNESKTLIEHFKSNHADHHADRQKVLKQLQKIPGVGKSIAVDLWELGFRSAHELHGQEPEVLYQRLNELKGMTVDRCMLYVLRCAVYFASTNTHDPELLKWWNWKHRELA